MSGWKYEIDLLSLVFDQESSDLSDETYDTTYNSACVLLSSGQYAEAEKKLRKADGNKMNRLRKISLSTQLSCFSAQCRRELEEEGEMTEVTLSNDVLIITQ